ncbi:MAG: hypothetical protein K9L28_00415 [Synergistales bacterium]|nr:hypothetical protein [Synergistales bacterium]
MQNREYTPDQRRVIQELRQADRKVRAHEQAHMAAGGELAGGARYSFQTGPDGRRYAVGGEVSIRIPKGDTPEETITLMEKVKRAALAPADPSPQDYRVASRATLQMAKARQQETSQVQSIRQEGDGGGDSGTAEGDQAAAQQRGLTVSLQQRYAGGAARKGRLFDCHL